MNLLKFVPIKLTFCLVLGILFGRFISPNIHIALFLVLFSQAILAILHFSKKANKTFYFTFAAGSVVICLGIFSFALWQPENYSNHYTHQDSKGSHTWRIKIGEVMKSTDFSDRYVVVAKSFDNKNVSGKLLLSIPSDSTQNLFKVDDELIIYNQIQEIRPPLNPYQFDYRAYLATLGITHQLRTTSKNALLIRNPSKTLFGKMASLRDHIISNLKTKDFGEDELGIIQALLLGQRNDISETTYNNYKNAGAIHILAVSGLHIGILLLLLEFLLRPLEFLPKGKSIKLMTIVILLWGFAFLAGLSASVVRAVTMFTFIAYALFLNRPSNTFNILALSMFFILLAINPMLLFQVGFQMSYAAVFAIVWIYPILQKFWYPKNWLVRKIWQLLSVSFAAQLGVLPISLFYFHQFPGLFFVSNLLIIPFLGVILALGILVILLALFNILPTVLVSVYNAIIGSMNNLIGLVSQQESFVFKNISFDWIQMILAYFIIICLTVAFFKPNFKRTFGLLISIIAFQVYLIYTSFNTHSQKSLIVAHKIRNSVFLHQTGSKLTVFSMDPNAAENLVTDYQVARRIDFIEHFPLKNSYTFNNKKLCIIDSLGILPEDSGSPDYLLLTQSPKINLERLIDSLNPKYIVSDGSNYQSYINRWEATCLKRKLPFHNTGEKGAYYFE